MKPFWLQRTTTKTLLTRLIEAPELVQAVRALPAPAFAAMIRHIGIEDAGEIVALATTEQLVAAFDADLFVNTQPGEREEFDVSRFAAWLEVLLEAGNEVAANRVAELSEDFVTRALSALVLVLDNDTLLARLSEGGDEVTQADKALESSLSEEVDGYLLISRSHEGWDALLTLILALDRDHRAFLERLLDRCANIASGYLDDLEALSSVLNSEDSLAEDVEAEREERLGKQGYVEPRMARSFLTLARKPIKKDASSMSRDPVTRSYFRNLKRPSISTVEILPTSKSLGVLLGKSGAIDPSLPPLSAGFLNEGSSSNRRLLSESMNILRDAEPVLFRERMEEFAYLANVIVAGAEIEGRRFRPSEAAEAVLATVELGAMLEARERRAFNQQPQPHRISTDLSEVLRTCMADVLFCKSSSVLANSNTSAARLGFLCSYDELDNIVGQLDLQVVKPSKTNRSPNRSH